MAHVREAPQGADGPRGVGVEEQGGEEGRVRVEDVEAVQERVRFGVDGAVGEEDGGVDVRQRERGGGVVALGWGGPGRGRLVTEEDGVDLIADFRREIEEEESHRGMGGTGRWRFVCNGFRIELIQRRCGFTCEHILDCKTVVGEHQTLRG